MPANSRFVLDINLPMERRNGERILVLFLNSRELAKSYRKETNHLISAKLIFLNLFLFKQLSEHIYKSESLVSTLSVVLPFPKFKLIILCVPSVSVGMIYKKLFITLI